MNAETLIVKRTCKFRLITPNTAAGAAQRAMFAQLPGASRVVWNAGENSATSAERRLCLGLAGMGPRSREVADIFRRDCVASKNSAMTIALSLARSGPAPVGD